MSDTSGFYKLDNKLLLYGQNFIVSHKISLLREHKDSYTYPVDGWMWFDNQEAARLHFNLPSPEPEIDPRPVWMRAVENQPK